MNDRISVKILGDFGPFSKVGKSIGYQLTCGTSTYLIDCGSPPFKQIGGYTLKNIDGMIITHCHDDHKRWFTDIALFYLYETDMSQKISLITSEDIYDELIRASGPALDRSLSKDSKNIIDIAYEDYVNFLIIGPRAKYRIVSKDEGGGKTALYITDSNGIVPGPDKAKIVISKKTKRPRMLFKDPYYKEWVEPESFYPFSSNTFYEENKNIYKDKEGFTLEAIKAPVWHGISCIGIKVRTDSETLVFSSDTAHDKNLWKQLYSEKRKQQFPLSQKEFESASVIYGDINDYIERIWSEERYREAVNVFRDAIVIHDISSSDSIVHTDYEILKNTFLHREKAILTHSPDVITSEWVLCGIEKTYEIINKRFFEKVDNRLYPMDADIYHREGEKFYVGYKNENGRYIVYEENGLLRLSNDDGENNGKPLYRVDLYEDISGKYFPYLEGRHSMYFERKDETVERIEFTDQGMRGKIVENQRDRLMREKEDTETAEPFVEKDPLTSM
jgi:ribonuclease BN (tRNA processing enzyme)